LGRNRQAELSSAQAQVARLQSVLASLDGRLVEAREALASLCALPPETALAPPAEADEPQALEFYEAAVERQPAVRAALAAVALAEAVRQSALGAFGPSLAVEGNWYAARQADGAGPIWDLGLSLELPIFRSGAQKARLDQADAALEQARLELARRRRLALQEARQAWQAEAKARVRRDAAQAALEAAEASVRDQIRDFKNSLITSLDLLRAQDAVESARLEALQARWDLERARLRLKLAGGALRP
jgi:outer membrane protein TolC